MDVNYLIENMHELFDRYVTVDRNMSALDEWIAQEFERHMVITGESGLGKSALIANWLDRHIRRRNLGYALVYCFVGDGGGLSSPERIMDSLYADICERFGWSQDVTDRDSGKRFSDLMARVVEEDRRLLIVLDGVDQLVDDDGGKQLAWLPDVGGNVRMLFSTLADDHTMGVFRMRGYQFFNIEPLDGSERRRMIEDCLERARGKSLDDGLISRIVDDELCRNTLVLKSLLTVLAGLGAHKWLKRRINFLLKPDNIDSFFQAVLESYEEDFGYWFVRNLLSLIYMSRKGLTENELYSVLNHGSKDEEPKVPTLALQQFYCAFGTLLTSRKGLLCFSHSYIRKAVKARYMTRTYDYVTNRRYYLCDVFEGQNTRRAYFELAFQYNKLQEWGRLHDLLLKQMVFYWLYREDENLMAGYWRNLQSAGFALADCLGVIDGAQSEHEKVVVALCLAEFLGCHFGEAEIALKALDAVRDMPMDRKERVFFSYGMGKANLELGHYDVAREYYGKVLGLREENGERNTLEIATSYSNLGDVSFAVDDYRTALEYYHKALKVVMLSKGRNSLSALALYRQIASVYFGWKDYDAALKNYLIGQEISLKIWGDRYPRAGSLYNSLGICYMELNDYDKAKDYLWMALRFYHKQYGRRCVESATTYMNIGVLFQRRGFPEQAKKHMRMAITLKEERGIMNISMADEYKSLANVYYLESEYDEAKALYKKALQIYSELKIEVHPGIISLYKCLGRLYRKIDNYGKSASYLKKALEQARKVYGRKHGTVGAMYFDLGRAYRDDERLDKALECYGKGLKIAEAAKTDPAYLATYYNNTGVLLKEMQRGDEAMVYYRRCLDIRKGLYGESHPDVASVLKNMACVYLDGRFYSDAIEYFYRSALSYLNYCYSCLKDKRPVERLEDYMDEVSDAEAEIFSLFGMNALSARIYYESGRIYRLLSNGYKASDCFGDAFMYANHAVNDDSSQSMRYYDLACLILGECYRHGYGTPANLYRATKWYKEAKNHGNKTAAMILARKIR